MVFYAYPNRLLCEVLEEMRRHTQHLNRFNTKRYKASMSMLIEEAQTLANRMEAALQDWGDVRRAHEKLKELKEKIKNQEGETDNE